MKRIFIVLMLTIFACSAVNAQGVLGRLGQRAKDAAENAIGNKIEGAINEGIDKATTKKDRNKSNDNEEASEQEAAGTWTCPECGATGNTGKFCKECGAKRPDGNSESTIQPKKVEAVYAKSDFVPGDEIIFDDDFADEQLGEFPSKWELMTATRKWRPLLAARSSWA